MALDFPYSYTVGYLNRTSNDISIVNIDYAANTPFYFSCDFKLGWDGTDDKYFISLQNGDGDGNVFNYGIYTNRLLQYSVAYDTGTISFGTSTKYNLTLKYTGTILYVYLNGQLVNSRSLSIAYANRLRIGEYHNYATADSWIGELWNWSFTYGTTVGEFVSTAGPMYYMTGGSWSTTPETVVSNPTSNLFKYRTIITHGYVLGGYKDSSPWKNVNRTVHATDVTTNLGDKLDYGASYANGGYSDYNAYVYGVADSFSGASTWTTSMSMATESNRAHNSNWDTKTTRDDTGVIINSSNTIGYITGTYTATDKHNYVTDTMYAAGSVGDGPTGGSSYGNVASWMGQFKGWIYAAGGANFTFSTETWSSGGVSVGTDGWGKALSSKHGWAYVKNGGNCVYSAYKIDDTSGTQLRTDLNFDYSGEENYQMGQNWGYCLGHYNGVQNCNTYRVNYITDAYTQLGSTSQPKGHDGMSSGATAPAAASVVGILY